MQLSKFNLILEINKLKDVYRTNKTAAGRNESTAEHTWSLTLIFSILEEELKEEFGEFDVLKVYKLCLMHDLVEIYAGDADVYDEQSRTDKEANEHAAARKFAEIEPELGKMIEELWLEFERKESLESKIAQACDKLDPLFLRLHAKDSLKLHGVNEAKLDSKKFPYFEFSKVVMDYYLKLKQEVKSAGLL